MDSTTSETTPVDDRNEESVGSEAPETSSSETPPQKAGRQVSAETKWQVVAKTPGLTPAQIVADSLTAEGIPARAWQEGAGVAFGLTVGLLGTGYVAVPEEFEEEAKSILALSEEDYEDEFNDVDEDA